jgi:hypothetical protein
MLRARVDYASMVRVGVTLAALVPAAALAACMTTSHEHPEQVQTTSQAEHENIEGAVTAPLRDFNLMRTKIPQVLLEAMSDPYYRPPGQLSCEDLANLLQPVNDALGPDIDEFPPAQKGMVQRTPSAAYGLVAGAATGAVPFHSWIRKLSGAERHDSYVQQAITAGAVRRAYLKGLGEAKNCPPPTVPKHVRTGSPVMTQEVKARFPTKLLPGHGTHDGRPPDDPPQ